MENYFDIDRKTNLKCELFDRLRHTDILYHLLFEKKFPISHRKKISRKKHNNFCQSHPYRYWYVVFIDRKPIGAFYLTNKNSIGINLTEEYIQHASKILLFVLETFSPLPAIPSVRPGNWYWNLSPENHQLIEVAKKQGGDLFQVSYKFQNTPIR